MDTLQDWEIYDLYKMIQYADTNEWEMTRWLMYVVAQVNSRKKLDLNNILKFPWEKEESEDNTSISDDDIVKLKKLAKDYVKNIIK